MTSRTTKLLVVDDEPDMRQLIQDVGLRAGFEVNVAADLEGFSRLFSTDTDLIVLDLLLPDSDGIELIRFLADTECTASLILVSGLDKGVLNAAQNLAWAHGLNVLGTLPKPFKVGDLRDLMGREQKHHKSAQRSDGELPTQAELRNAIEQRQLELAYQPQFSMLDGRLSGVEALLRWRHPVKGPIPPNIFVPLAEQGDLIHLLTNFVLEQAVADCGADLAAGRWPRIAINMSPRNLNDLSLPERICDLLSKSGLKPSQFVIEVTETAVCEDDAKFLDILTRLRMKGFQLSIDDFGTGYSSLAQLVRAPFTELKVDQSFIRRMETDVECRAVIDASVMLAHRLGMRVVAEGIENETVWRLLSDLGCDEGQGFWMSPPVSVDLVRCQRAIDVGPNCADFLTATAVRP